MYRRYKNCICILILKALLRADISCFVGSLDEIFDLCGFIFTRKMWLYMYTRHRHQWPYIMFYTLAPVTWLAAHVCSFCTTAFSATELWSTFGPFSKTCSSRTKLEPPCPSCFISQHSRVLKTAGDQWQCRMWGWRGFTDFILWIGINPFNWNPCFTVGVKSCLWRTWKLWIFLYVVACLAYITAVIGVIVTLSNYFLWMSSGIFY